MSRTVYIVWNADRTEGFVTDDKADAMQASSGRFRNPSSTLGEAFFEAYEDDDRPVERIDLPDLTA